MQFTATRKDPGGRHPGRPKLWSPMPADTLEGPAQLFFSDHRRSSIDAQAFIRRSLFALSGGGCFTCDQSAALDAISSPSWLKLAFREGSAFSISVYEIRASEAEARCWFEVHA